MYWHYSPSVFLRCGTDVVEQGIECCREWFEVKWQDCMDTIKAPIINHILCVSMRFHFLCDIMRGRGSTSLVAQVFSQVGWYTFLITMMFAWLLFLSVMKTWCREDIPVEGNFGQTFDKLNFSIDTLSREFGTNVWCCRYSPTPLSALTKTK